MRHPTLALAALLLVGAIPAQQVQAAAPRPAPFTIPPGDLKIAQLVDQAARYLHANFVVADPKLLADPTPFTLTEPVTTDRAGCLRALAAVLSTRGLAVVPLDADHDIYEIVHAWSERGVALQRAGEFVPSDQVLADPDGKQAIVTVVPLQHVRAPELTGAMRQFLASSEGIGAARNGESLIVAGERDHVAEVVRFAVTNDAPAADAATMQRLAAHVQRLEAAVAALRARLAATPREGK